MSIQSSLQQMQDHHPSKHTPTLFAHDTIISLHSCFRYYQIRRFPPYTFQSLQKMLLWLPQTYLEKKISPLTIANLACRSPDFEKLISPFTMDLLSLYSRSAESISPICIYTRAALRISSSRFLGVDFDSRHH